MKLELYLQSPALLKNKQTNKQINSISVWLASIHMWNMYVTQLFISLKDYFTCLSQIHGE